MSFKELRRPVFDDCVVSEDPLLRLVDSDEVEEFFFCGRGSEYSSPIQASCLVRVGGNRTPSVGVDDVVARRFLVTLDSVLFLLRAETFADVVTSVVEVDGGVSDWSPVAMVSVDVEGVEGALVAGFKAEDNMVVYAFDLVVFLNDFEPRRGEVVQVVGDVVDGEITGLREGQEEALSVKSSRRHQRAMA